MTEKQAAVIVDLYVDKEMSIEAVRRATGRSKYQVTGVLRGAGVLRRQSYSEDGYYGQLRPVALARVREGESPPVVAQELGIDRSTIYNWMREVGLRSTHPRAKR